MRVFLDVGGKNLDPGQDTLLPGEATSIGSDRLDDARHWVAVYSELCGFKQGLLATVADQAGSVSAEGKAEVDRDSRMLTQEAERLSRRLEFWQGEVSRLSK